MAQVGTQSIKTMHTGDEKQIEHARDILHAKAR